MTEWIECSWTVYVNEPAAELPIELGIRLDLPQFTVTGLDPSFLVQVYTILRGKTEFEVAAEASDPETTEHRARQIASAVVIPNDLSVHVYAYPDEMCGLLASLDEPRIVDIASRWQALLQPSLHRNEAEPDFGPSKQRRESVLRQLANLSRAALASGKRLMTRVEFRRCSRDPETGLMHRYEGPKH